MASEAKNAQAPGGTTHERSQVHSAVQCHTLSFQNAVTLDTKSQGWERPCNLSRGKSNASLPESLLSPPHPISVRHYKYHVTQAPCAAFHVLQSRRGLQVLDAASTMRLVYLLAVLLEVALVQ
ncbi:hypothetical protein IscW_ISCW011037 [Ixodes scapularis]|uniref:Uncharacterized protein n=1 Tax=Ixodes scapularis TaxID=6945 RepID=B7Q4Y1_IXOSC|nr:hypothetical protein IscW_ISCW011037 [Ixodes scapularis]|eukprot:XP_002401195.1 hypothetical protein IscW_ISCW011037 [Ixodes scapularis]